MNHRRCTFIFAVCLLLTACAYAQPAEETINGELMIIEDSPKGRIYALRTPEGTVELKLDASQGDLSKHWDKLHSGMHLRVRGIRKGNALLMSSPYALDQRQMFEGLEPLPLPNTTGNHSVLLLMALWNNTAASSLPGFSFTRLTNDVTAAAEEFSFDQLTFTVTGTGWLPVALANTTCPFLQLADLADAAATSAGFILGNFQHIVYSFPFAASCGFKGIATVGGIQTRAWLNGFWDKKTGIHEIMGHNLGLSHSHACRTIGPLVVTQPCTVEEFEWLDTMGISPIDPATGEEAFPHFSAGPKLRLGWIGDAGPPIIDVVSSGVYTIGPYAEQTDVPKALRLPYLGQPGWDLTVEARQPFGSDAFVGGFSLVTSGVILHLTNPADGTSYLLDAHPLTSSWQDAALRVEEIFDQPDAGFSLHVKEVNTDGATVAVDLASDAISLELLTPPWQRVWNYGEVLRIDAQVLVGTQPAAGALWEFGYWTPGGDFVLEPTQTLGPDGIWTLEVPLTLGIPSGTYTLLARATWESKVTPIVSGQLLLQ